MIGYLQRAFLAGIAILLPLVLLGFAVVELFELMVEVATPIADALPDQWLPDSGRAHANRE